MGVVANVMRGVARLRMHGIRGRAFALAFVAAAAPVSVLIALSMSAAPSVLMTTGVALGVTAVALLCLLYTLRPVAHLAALLDQHAGAPSGAEMVVPDHHKRLLANAEAIAARLAAEKRRARTHPITHLPGREYLLAAVADDLRAQPDEPAMLGLLRIANYDHLLAFNHAAAERTLAAAAKRLAGAIKHGRPLAHVDRDCFAIWFTGEAAAVAAELEAIGYVLMQELKVDGFTVTPDIQLGSALYPIDADEPGNLLNRAFVSLARPQRTTDGAIAFFARPSPQEARRGFLLEQDLRQAIRRGELALHYQPIVDLAMGRVVGAEALLRWRSPTHEGATPDKIIKILEDTGLVHEIGLWTLNTACRQLRAWSESGLVDFKIAVNLSVHQLRDSALPMALQRTIAAHGLSPNQIELELTETAAMEDAARTHALFQELREAGFSLAIDDFGSGYSSLAYLRRLPFQKLKIDREFVSHVDQRADSRAICKALIDLTAGLELAVLAEGVERFEEVEILRSLGCSTFQGYYFSRPLPPEEFLTTITNKEWLVRTGSRVHRERDELRRRLS